MSAQVTFGGTLPRSGMNTNRAALQTRPLTQRILIRSWEYTPAVRVTVLILRMLGVLGAAFGGIALLINSNGWGLAVLAGAFAVLLPFSLWVYTTAAKGWPAR
jgi:hypothetical protein